MLNKKLADLFILISIALPSDKKRGWKTKGSIQLTKIARNRKTVEEDMSGADTFTTRFTYDTGGNLIAVWSEQ